MRVAVIGVGTPRGDDAAGLAVAAVLAARALPEGVAVRTCERPVPDLLDALAGADAVVIVDAARAGAAPGAVVRLAADDLDRAATGSSHGLGVAHALRLAQALGRAPARVKVVGVEVGEAPSDRLGALSAPVRAGVAGAADAVCAILRELS